MRVMALSGWGQKAESLAGIMPEGAKVTYVPYAAYGNAEALFKALREEEHTPDILIGWSLGGQLAARLVAEGVLSPKLLVLLAAPFQYLADEKHPYGMNPVLFWTFCQSFRAFPAKTMQRFLLLITYGDSHMKQLAQELDIDNENLEAWADWLDELRQYSCERLALAKFPRTLIVGGDHDEVVPVQQAHIWKERIPGSRLEVIPSCGHAPHLHAQADLKRWIEEEWAKCTS